MTVESAAGARDRSYVIVITARDEAKYPKGTLRCRRPNRAAGEMVIVDDGSKDATGAIAMPRGAVRVDSRGAP